MIRCTAISAILALVTLLLESESVLISPSNGDHALVLLPYNSAAGLTSISRQQRNKRGISTTLDLVFFRIQSDIRYRYSRTYVTSHVINRDSKNGQEVTFQVVLPETAFISKFSMEIDGKTYEAYVKEKEEAKRVYDQAQSQGQSAGLVALNTRHSNVFNVNVNIKANSIVSFNLTYEELLSRRLGRYEQVININGEQVSTIEDAQIVVSIEESQELTLVRVPNLRGEAEVIEDDKDTNKDAVIEKPSPKMAKITWRSPSNDLKKQLSGKGNVGKFIVQYEIERESEAGEVLIMNGYFVHFFAPPNLKPLRKHVVFVLDISGSMSGRKIEQLKEAMLRILSDLSSEDYLNIIIFSTDVVHWSPGDTFSDPSGSGSYRYGRVMSGTPAIQRKLYLHEPFAANSDNIKKAKEYIQSLQATGSTNIHDALMEALNLTVAIRRARDEYHGEHRSKRSAITGQRFRRTAVKVQVMVEILPPLVESLIIFLTDGEPTIGVTDRGQIQTLVQAANRQSSIPIFSLAFGEGADFPFLRKLSLQNYAFARKIYEAADAALQLQGFYKEIASPLLTDVQFNYTSGEAPYTVKEVTTRRFPTLFGGTEIAVAGRMDSNERSSTDEGPPAKDGAKMVVTREALVQYVPTDRCHFYMDAVGTGRGGERHWGRPMMYIRHPPWWCPYPGTTTTTTPRPEKTQEDTFLERLWAYLTIQQLIEKDFVQDASKMVGEETPKKKALRLALKYGFVTPMTSLVVVKPDEKTDVTDALAADKLGQVQNYAGAAGVGFQARQLFASPGMAAVRRGGDISTLRMVKTASRPMMASGSSAAATRTETADYVQDDEMETVGRKKSQRRKSKSENGEEAPSTTTRSAVKTTARPLTLRAVKWWRGGEISVAEQNYKVLRDQDPIDESGGAPECNIRSGDNSPFSKVKGQCRHLRDCVQNAFADDFILYKKSYFCPIRVAEESYAGVCCDEKRAAR